MRFRHLCLMRLGLSLLFYWDLSLYFTWQILCDSIEPQISEKNRKFSSIWWKLNKTRRLDGLEILCFDCHTVATRTMSPHEQCRHMNNVATRKLSPLMHCLHLVGLPSFRQSKKLLTMTTEKMLTEQGVPQGRQDDRPWKYPPQLLSRTKPVSTYLISSVQCASTQIAIPIPWNCLLGISKSIKCLFAFQRCAVFHRATFSEEYHNTIAARKQQNKKFVYYV